MYKKKHQMLDNLRGVFIWLNSKEREITSFLTYWSYDSLALSYRYDLYMGTHSSVVVHRLKAIMSQLFGLKFKLDSIILFV